MTDQDLRNRVVEKMLRNRTVGRKNRTVNAVANMVFPSHEQGRGKRLIDEMLADPSAPLQRYGGQRQAIQLTAVGEAVAYLKANGGNVPFGFE